MSQAGPGGDGVSAIPLDGLEHGGIEAYRKGCVCDLCRRANADYHYELREARKRTPFDQIPHGLNGYSNYGCHCDTCDAAGSEANRKARERRNGGRPAGSPDSRWSAEELEEAARGDLTSAQVAERLGRTLGAVRAMRSALGVKDLKGRRAVWGKSRFKGVTRESRSDKWRALLSFEGRQLRVGSFATEFEAALAYDRAAVERLGAGAVTNLSLGRYSGAELEEYRRQLPADLAFLFRHDED